MGFSTYYRSTEPIEPKRRHAIQAAVDELNKGRTWLSCEPVFFFTDDDDEDGRLSGGSKPAFEVHPDDAKAAAAEGLPDGTLKDVVDILCELSRKYDVDWEFSHDADPGPIGYIRDGTADDGLIAQIEAIARLGSALTDMLDEFDSAVAGFDSVSDFINPPPDSSDDDDEPPSTIKMWKE